MMRPIERPWGWANENSPYYRIDEFEHRAVMLYTLQLPTACQICFNAVLLGGYSDHLSLCIALPVLLFEAAYGLKLIRHIRELQGRTSCLGGRHTTLAHDRLKQRLRYLMLVYGDHAIYWRFVVWARQLALIAISCYMRAFGEDHGVVLVGEAAATLSVLVTFLIVHLRTQPYTYCYQNALEGVMAAGAIVAVTICFIYRSMEVQPRFDLSEGAIDAAIILTLLGPACVVTVWLLLKALPRSRKIVNLNAAAAEGRSSRSRELTMPLTST